MAGLDSIKKYAEAGSVQAGDSSYSASDQTSGGIPGYDTKTGTVGKIALSADATKDILANMQKYLDEREGFMPSLARGLSKGVAAGYGPSALTEYNRQQQAEEKQAMDYRQTMAALGSASQSAAQRRANMGTTLAGLQGGAAGTAGAPGSGLTGGYDQNLLARVEKLYQNQQFDEGDKLLNAHISDIAKINRTAQVNKESYTKGIEVNLPNGDIGYVSLDDVLSGRYKPTAKGAAQLEVAKETAPVTAKPFVADEKGFLPTEGNAVAMASALDVPLLSADRDLATQTKLYNASLQPGYKGPPVAKPGTSKHETGNAIDVDPDTFTKEHADMLTKAGFTQPLPKTDPNHWQFAGAPVTTAPAEVARPAAPVTPVTTPTIAPVTTAVVPTSTANITAPAPTNIASPITASQKTGIEAKKAGAVKGEEELGKQYATAEFTAQDAGRTSGERAARQTAILDILEDPEIKTMVGKFQTGAKADAFIRQMQAGIQAGNFGSIGLQELQENLSKEGMSKTAITKFSQLEGYLKDNELEWSKRYLNGQGSVSDNERRLVQQAIGSVRDPIGKLAVLAGSMKERAIFDKEIALEYKQFKKRTGGNFGDFLDSDEYDKVNNVHNTRLAGILKMDPNQIKTNDGYKLSSGASEPKATPTAYSDPEKEKRFQEFKKNNPPKK